MKTKSLLALMNSVITLVLLSCSETASWGAETLGTDQRVREDLGVDVVDGVTNKIVRVAHSAAHVELTILIPCSRRIGSFL